MMHTWFECKIRYERVMENGMNKKVTEPYLVDALSFTEAEARIIEEMTPFISGEFTISDIKRANYSELFPSDEESADRWFKCKLIFITLDDKSGAEKKTSTQVLVQAADLRDAVKKLDEGMKGTMADYQIASVAETAIMDVYPYSAEESITDTISENANSPIVRNFIQSLPEGCKTTITVGGKKVVVDKTGKDTIVTPKNENSHDIGRDALKGKKTKKEAKT
ncbi:MULTISPECIES: DUF4494 domain-containing protein [Bacteroides]|jgi:hypothetical protein|uniref:DUF4494 domain-containing protein n=1 Tax=Bacteroides TaxID=816 RepID=UPI002054D297|nr:MULTISPECIES: DUF4494 domain-containing protein [Bacteroides]MCS2299785.1 DUF4494 domain-containing protein [Bacteroides ovatus]UVY29173.1 MAG: protein of unknown function DUF4494 [Bacteriophage sp.]UYJ21036.1 MAG: DUF4494 domain-containing protein [Bacteroides ovatus]DAV46886.1 MAG TPA: protein of unknown function (DUF4494) [Caudoviricetes sp.]